MNRRRWAFLVLLLANMFFFWRLQPHLEKSAKRETAPENLESGEPHQAIFSSRGKTSTMISKIPTPSRRIAEAADPAVLRASKLVTPKDSDLGDALDSIGLASWKIWRGIGITQKGSEPRDVRLTGEVAGYSLFESSSFSGRLGQFDLSSPMAVYNDRTHKAGVVTGSIRVVLKDGVGWDEVSKDHDLTLIAPFPQIKTYMVTSPRSPFDLTALLTELQNDSRIDTTKAEVLSRDYNKN
ncbi:hypothetical protein BH10BDE1_BH10BDE1_12810 [soil metagenome]